MVKTRYVLIFGGSGYVGKKLTMHLESKGYVVVWATRKLNRSHSTKQVVFDWRTGIIESGALDGVYAIINLSGANIGAKRWTKSYRKEILESRVGVADFIAALLSRTSNEVETYIGASAIGYYGAKTDGRIHEEPDLPGDDFLAKVCAEWEAAHNRVAQQGAREIILRTAVVFNRDSEAFKRMLAPIRMGLGAALGTGKQAFPWIHIEDLCSAYEKALSDERMEGVFNVVATEQPSNKDLVRQLASATKHRIWIPSIPVFVLLLIFGEIAKILVNGNPVSPKRLMDSGFTYKFSKISQVINEITDKRS